MTPPPPRFPVHSSIHARAGPGGSVPFSDWLRTFFLFLAQRRLRLVSSVPGESTARYTFTGVSCLISVCRCKVLICVCFCVFLFISLQVLFRLNFLVLVLCVVMDRPYQFYYFVPLVTFWFVVIYGTLAMWPQILQKKANSRCQRAFNCVSLRVLVSGDTLFVLHNKCDTCHQYQQEVLVFKHLSPLGCCSLNR